MLVQKRKEQMKAFEKQEKRLKELKASGKSTKQAVSVNFPSLISYLPAQSDVIFQEKNQKDILSRKQNKSKKKDAGNDEDEKPQELLQKPRDYIVKFTFPNPPSLSPPILGLHCEFTYL
jgi:ATP-binding cassette subfamily F protein 1